MYLSATTDQYNSMSSTAWCIDSESTSDLCCDRGLFKAYQLCSEKYYCPETCLLKQGLMNKISNVGASYFVTFIDDMLCYTIVYFF